MPPIDLVSRLLYRDALMLVVDKPPGLAVHPGPKGGDSLEAHFGQLRFGLPRDPALAHRLDRDTSGCLVLGRHRKALQRLGAAFKGGRVGKTYWAVVEGAPEADEGVIDLPLGRRDATRGWWMAVDPAGQGARTGWRVLGRGGGRAWLELMPVTGRTHQIRVHCAALGWPLVGDAVYGHAVYGHAVDGPPAAGPPAETLHLLARRVAVPLYPSRPPVAVEAPVPAHMAAALAALGWGGADAAVVGAAPDDASGPHPSPPSNGL